MRLVVSVNHSPEGMLEGDDCEAGGKCKPFTRGHVRGR